VTAKLEAWLEVGAKKTFAGAIAWPGWERSGRDPDAAVARLAEYGPRYVRVLSHSRLGFEAPDEPADFRVVERVTGNATTDYGAPGVGPAADERPVTEEDLDRLIRILEAAWQAFDRTTAAAEGVTLTTGPRGGGRSVEKMREHVFDAEGGYLTAFGARPQAPASGDDPAGSRRRQELAALRAKARGEPVEHPSNTKRLWTPRFFVRRTAWHALDHAWELEDRSGQVG
jgi:hypothetical protein